MKKILILILFLIIFIFSLTLKVQAFETKNLVNIYFFHSNTCTHCKEETKYLSYLEKRYNNIKIYKYEIHDKNNYDLLEEVGKIYDINIKSVPLTIIGNKVYTGYSEKSKIKFIKTIEYFSKYGYQDKLGEYLKLELPTYNIKETDISLDKFIKNYYNYNLLGLSTDNLDTTSIALLLGVLLSFNIISIIGIILTLLTISFFKIKQEQTNLLLLILYPILITILLLKSLSNNNIINICITIIILIIFIYNMIKGIKKHKKYLIINIIVLISTTITTLIPLFSGKYILIFKNLLQLHDLTGFLKISYYTNCLVINLIINLLIIYIGYIISKKIRKIAF